MLQHSQNALDSGSCIGYDVSSSMQVAWAKFHKALRTVGKGKGLICLCALLVPVPRSMRLVRAFLLAQKMDMERQLSL